MPLFTSRPRPAGASDPESGYVLLAVIFMTFMVLLSLAVAAPKIATSIQREKEIETIHRGEQYKRALQLYYRKFGRYPTTIDQLVNTNNIRFLRKRYKDPLTGKDDWKLVRFGQAHVRPLGFFGQPLGAGAMGGLAGASIISGSMYAPMPATNPDGTPASTDATTALSGAANQTSTGNGPSMAGNPGGFGSAPNPGFGSSGSSSFGSTGSSGFGSTTNTGFGSAPGGFGSNPGMGSNPSTGFGSPTSAGTGGANSPFSTGGGAGTTFGGSGFIVGVTLPVDKPSLLDYKKQTRYNRWEFNYDPMEDQMKQVAGAGGGPNNLNGNGTNMPGVGNPNMPGMGSPFGSSNTGGTSGPFGGTGTSGSSPFGGTGTSGSGPSFGGVSSGSGSGSNSGNSGGSDGGTGSGGTNNGTNGGSGSGSSGTQQPQPQ